MMVAPMTVILKEHEIDEERSAQQNSLAEHIQLLGKCDAKEGGICEHFTCETGKFFRDFAHVFATKGDQIEIDTKAEPLCTNADGSLNAQHSVATTIEHTKRRPQHVPLLFDRSNCLAWRSWDMYSLQAAGEPTGHTGQWTVHVQYLLFGLVEYLNMEGSNRAAIVASTKICVFYRIVDLLATTISNWISVVRLIPAECVAEIDPSPNEKTIDICKVFQSARTVRNSCWCTHPSGYWSVLGRKSTVHFVLLRAN